jgi:hypothetical protein
LTGFRQQRSCLLRAPDTPVPSLFRLKRCERLQQLLNGSDFDGVPIKKSFGTSVSSSTLSR